MRGAAVVLVALSVVGSCGGTAAPHPTTAPQTAVAASTATSGPAAAIAPAATARPSPAPGRTPTPPPTPTTAAFGIRFDPATPVPGSRFTLIVFGLDPGELVEIRIAASGGVGRTESFTADPDGEWRRRFPADRPSGFAIEARRRTGEVARAEVGTFVTAVASPTAVIATATPVAAPAPTTAPTPAASSTPTAMPPATKQPAPFPTPTTTPTPLPAAAPTPVPTPAQAPTQTPPGGPNPLGISNVYALLSQCPNEDRQYSTFVRDFTIRRERVPVTAINCVGDYSKLDPTQLSDEVISMQIIRTAYYMDRGQTVTYPWTAGRTMYEWWRSQIAGIDIRTLPAGISGYCCDTIAGRKFIVIGPRPLHDREFFQSWKGISSNIGFFSHEIRHLTGPGHVDCTRPAYPIVLPSGCEASYDETNLSSFGVQYWLNRAWLVGTINVGIGCLAATERADLAGWHLSSANGQFRERFMGSKPPLLSLPAAPGGSCVP